jgi:hypothetical protein
LWYNIIVDKNKMIQEKDIMLTIKSNFNNFRDRQGQRYIAEDLEKLCKALVTSDIVNFPVMKEMSAGYTEAIAWKIADRLVLVEDGKYLIINDISLQVVNALTDLGIKPANIYLAYGKWKTNAEPDTDPTLYLLMKQYIKANIVETFNIIKLEDIFTVDIKFNGVIANPPYGKIGAQITEKIKDKVDYEQYINLLPANDCKRYNKIYQFVRNMETIKKGFKDATVTTHLCEIAKHANNITVEEFEISQYIDRSLDKYFEENSKRTHYAIDNHICKPKIARFRTIDLRKCFYTGKRDLAAGHLPYSKDTMSYKINFNLLTDHDEFLAKSSKSEQALGNSGNYTVVPFDTNEEKDNLINFLYSKLGFKFISKLFTAINVDCYVVPRKYLPKVDWTRAWTVEEILADYGYTETEIAEVIADLENFKDREGLNETTTRN